MQFSAVITDMTIPGCEIWIWNRVDNKPPDRPQHIINTVLSMQALSRFIVNDCLIIPIRKHGEIMMLMFLLFL